MNDFRRWDGFQDGPFIRRVLIVTAFVLLALILWKLSNVLILAFGAVLVAVILHAAADALEQYGRVPSRWALTTATILVVLLFVTVIVLFGAQMRTQLSFVAERLPFALNNMLKELGLGALVEQWPEMLGLTPGGDFVARIAGIGGAVLSGLADFLLVAIGGIYIAAAPRTYWMGLVKLFPAAQHDRIESSLTAAGRALRLWVIGQLIAMTIVGVLTATALWLIGVPSFIALGLIAGLMDFIPFVGPILGAVPAILLAFTVDGYTVLWTIGALVLIQQLEGNVIFPMIEKRAVAVPPALALFAIVAGGVLFGTPGFIFGFPLAVVAFVLVKKLYVRETLGEATPVPGEPASEAGRLPSK
ncbi:AI-2E family transporter [Microvirga massiliensis]|uniref:AI-2E family transporter n=1 Tax=Microvirga massiliensis TaxID=1033741 RepID=UPI00062B968F|nr:AI-2E family transporter [Microvirga massiliensis]